MQIDGHHTLTYIAARFAGYNHNKSSIIAHSAQYVDDATNSGLIHFKNRAMYKRISSAHRMIDPRNLNMLDNHQVWIPFHFLPGNGGLSSGENPDGSFINKIICTPDSYVARDMLKTCAKDFDKPYALHRLGITMHVYADTFAHQGFAGVNDEVNKIEGIKSNKVHVNRNLIEQISSYFISESFPLGHGAALSFPDSPFHKWNYTNGYGEKIERDNTEVFIEAVDKMSRAMRCFRDNNFEMNLESVEGIPKVELKKIKSLLKSIKDESGDERHKQWMNAIVDGKFSFGSAILEYIPKGKGSWKDKSIGQKKDIDTGREEFTYRKGFLKSNWKLFHDALQAHRFDVIHDILPKYGICAA